MPPLVTLHRTDKAFANGTRALSGIDLTVEAGEFVSLLGPSGCGKSTLLRLVAGLTEPNGGELRRDRALTVAGGIGYVFQDPTLLPWASVAENVWLPLRLAGESRRQAAGRIGEALARVGLDGFAAARPHELSGGMRMRVSIARALVTEPRLLLLDEPFAALDEITRTRLCDDLRRLWERQPLTVLFVTHAVAEAVFLSSRVVVMTARPGRIYHECPIPLVTPRAADVRNTVAFVDLCRELSGGLSAAMAA